MRNRSFFMAILSILFVFTACSSDDDNAGEVNLIVGTWKYNAYIDSFLSESEWHTTNEPVTLEFRANETFTERYNSEIEGEGNWIISGDILKLVYVDPEWGDSTDEFELLLLENSKFHIKYNYEDGEYRIDEFIKL